MIIGIGLDLCEIDRMERAFLQDGFAERFFSAEECETIRSRGKAAAQTAAACFAAKEALLKAMGCGIAYPLREISVHHLQSGQPVLETTGSVKKRLDEMGVGGIFASLTHENGMAAAVIVLEGKECIRPSARRI